MTMARRWINIVQNVRKRRHIAPIAALILAILLANAIALTGLYHDNPALFVSNLGVGLIHGPIPGFPNWLDPNIGYTIQALGHLAARDWLHGIPPWWDPYQGVGMPLAAELQNGALFLPFSLLLALHHGWLLLRLLMQLSAGLFTYALLIQLRQSRCAALIGGVLFACSSTFMILAHAPANTLPFLPLLLLGIERGLTSERRFAPGWSLVIIAIAFSFYAGFPETGFLADLLGGVWFLVRLSTQPRDRWGALVARFALATGIAMTLTLPGLIPFIHYVQHANIGVHAHGAAHAALPMVGLTAQLLPQSFGPFGLDLFVLHSTPQPALQALGQNWLSSGGWIGLLPTTLALAGLFSGGTRLRRLRWMLLGWIMLWETRIFGFAPVIALLDLAPFLRLIAVSRYAEPSIDFVIILLAATGIDRWRSGGIDHRVRQLLYSAVAVIVLIALGLGWPAFIAMRALEPHITAIAIFYLATMSIACIALLYMLSQAAIQPRLWLVGGILMADAIGGFGLPQAAGTTRGHLDLTGVAYLRRHEGLQRAFGLGPLAPNYASRYRVADIDMTALPMPGAWANEISTRLDPMADPTFFAGINYPHRTGRHTPAAELRRHLAAYQALGVRYILAPPGTNPLGTAHAPAFKSASMWIYQLHHAAPYFSTQPSGACMITVQSRIDLTASCHQNATLIRRELFAPGWHARVNHRAARIDQSAPLFQRITLQAGRSTIRFFYRPNFERRACALAGFALLAWIGLVIRASFSERRR